MLDNRPKRPRVLGRRTPEGLRIFGVEDIPHLDASGLGDGSTLRQALAEKGVCVVRNVLDEASCEEAQRGMMEDLSGSVAATEGGRRLDPWEITPKGPGGCSLWKNYGMALTPNAQARRTDERPKEVFKRLYGEHLCQSMDASAMVLAAWQAKKKSFPRTPNADPIKQVRRLLQGSTLRLHQDMTKTGRGGKSFSLGLKQLGGVFPEAVQGAMVYVAQVAKSTPDGSYLTPPGFIAAPLRPSTPEPIHDGGARDDWYVLQSGDFTGALHGDVLERIGYVEAPAGSLVLWLSSVIHGNTLGHAGLASALPPATMTRAVQMITWGPRALTTLGEAEKKVKMSLKGHSNNHWPHLYTYGGSGGHMSNRGGIWRTLQPVVIGDVQREALGIV